MLKIFPYKKFHQHNNINITKIHSIQHNNKMFQFSYEVKLGLLLSDAPITRPTPGSQREMDFYLLGP